jgi:hypothetical protein
MMKTQNTKIFAFQLADKQTKAATRDKKWQIREGVAVAGCSGFSARADYDIWGTYRGRDGGYYC